MRADVVSGKGAGDVESGIFSQFGQNAGYVEELYRLYQSDPSLVGESWARFFDTISGAVSTNGGSISNVATGNGSASRVSAIEVPSVSSRPEGVSSARPDLDSLLALQERATKIVAAYRAWGHLNSKVNPLTKGVEALPGSPELDPAFYGIGTSEIEQEVQCAGFAGRHTMRLGDLVNELRQVYCGPVGFEFSHVVNQTEREWLQQRAERDFPKRNWFGLEDRKMFYRRLHEAESLEAELHKRYVGAKRFSLQGGDTLMPMLEVLMTDAGRAGIQELFIGMAHRGRLNVLANIADKPLWQIFAEFEDASMASVIGAGDVKYHLSTHSVVKTRDGAEISVTLAPNPSHLEFVNPVVCGMSRARQDLLVGPGADVSAAGRKTVLPLLIHGDSAFIGQGIVSETLNFAYTKAYSSAGVLHLVINNQVGFTTDAAEARSSVYCTEIAKINNSPVLHVNSEDIEACCWAMRLALEYRQTFGRDIVLDLYCYRKYGHNEGDDPTYTQPLMYAELKGKKTLAEIYGAELLSTGHMSAEEQQAIAHEYNAEFADAAEALKFSRHVGEACSLYGRLSHYPADTGVEQPVLESIAKALVTYPEGFRVHPKLKGILDKRVSTLGAGEGIDWGFAESLAYGSLVHEGVSVRLTGQDVGRGTFSHRHLELHDYETPARFYPLREVAEQSGAGASFELYNSVLSEAAVMGFEFGYAAVHPKALVLWEAQFGDFANGAQVIIDQFLAASEVKWGQRCGLVLLLPHGSEGQGPEHSSARIERFLQLCAEGNMSVAIPTTPAQYFHLLRRQGLSSIKRPLVVMTPKSLLRHPEVTSTGQEFTHGAWQPVLSEALGAQGQSKEPVDMVFVSGKIFYDARAYLNQSKASNVRLVRIEQLYPFPKEELQAELKKRSVRRAIWVQDEPENMGAWNFLRPRLEELLGAKVAYAGRPEGASTAAGSARWHAAELKAIMALISKHLA